VGLIVQNSSRVLVDKGNRIAGPQAEGLTVSLGTPSRLAQDEEPGLGSGEARGGRGLGQEGVAVTSATLTNLLARGRRGSASVFVVEAWVRNRWEPIARSDNEASAHRLFNQASYTCPVETLLRLRRGSDVLIKMPADGRGNVR
jgi:hypothetical protein